jgi:hypothetical protein
MANAALDQFVEMRQRAEEARRQREEAAETLVRDIQAAREEITSNIDRLYRLAIELRTMSRRSLDEGAQSYIMFANAHMRLAGALNQGVKRTGSTDRVLKIGQAEREDARRRDEALRQKTEARENRKAIDKLMLTSDDAFDEIYGDVVQPEGGE